MALRQLARTLDVPRFRAPYPRLPSAPRAWSAAPARSRPFSSHHQDRRPTKDWEEQLNRWREERSKATKQIEEELRRNEKWEVVAQVASGVVVSAGLLLLIGASGAIGFVFGVPFGIILGVGIVGAAIDKMKQEVEEEDDDDDD